MKTLNHIRLTTVLLFCFSFFSVSTSFANELERNSKLNKKFKSLFHDAKSQLGLEAPMEIETIITVNEEGRAEILSISSDDEMIRQFVEQRVSNTAFDLNDVGTFRLIYKYKK